MSNFDDNLFVDREQKYKGFQKLLQPQTRQAIMAIAAAKDMGKTWLINKLEHHCRSPEVGCPVARVDFRNPREIHKVQDGLGLIRLLRDKLGSPAHFNQLNATINRYTDAQRSSTGLVTLRRNLETYFNLDDLQAIAFDLSIKYENLAGDTLRAKSIELVRYCERHNLIEGLLNLCAELRPHVDWSNIASEIEANNAPAATTAATNAIIKDNNAPIWADSAREMAHAQTQINDAFFQCLSDLMQAQGQVVLLFDSLEEAPPEVVEWLRIQLLTRLRDGQIPDAVLIFTGRTLPDWTDLNIKHLLVKTGLSTFTEDYVREYFVDRRQITDLDLRTITLTSGGIPGALAMMADQASLVTAAEDDFFNNL